MNRLFPLISLPAMNESVFVFGEWTGVAVFNAEIPAGIRSKKDLLELLGTSLNFPSYYGVNWDAFEECIRDFSWLPAGTIVIKHNDIPVENDKVSAKTYLEILRDAIAKWSGCKERNLVVLFPAKSENKVMGMLID